MYRLLFCNDSTNAGCSEGEIRLVEGRTELEGTVEFCRNNQWGAVCIYSFDSNDARVVCRQLGFSVAGIYSYMHDRRHIESDV